MKKEPESYILSLSEKKYRTFIENCLDAIMITAQDGTIYSANHAACSMLGYDEKDICKLGRKRIVDNNQQLFEALEQRRKTGKYFGELTYIKKDGTKFPVEISSSVSANSDGRELTTIIIRDITQRKKTEKSLLESEARLRLASQATGFGIYSYDFVTRVSYFSDEFLALYGILAGNTIEHNIDLLERSFHPEDKEYFLNSNYKANDPEGSGILDVEFRIIKSDGEIRWLKARGRTIFSGNSKEDKPLHSNGLMQDITERKVIENAIKQAHDWQETIFEGSLDAIFISDEDSVLIAVNSAACELTGYSKEELLKMRIPDLHDEQDLEAYRKYHKKIFKGEIILSEAKIKRRDGLKVDAEFNNSRISISGKYYMHTTARDITFRKIAEIALMESEEKFRTLFESMRQGVFYQNSDGRLTDINQSALDMFGIIREEFLRRTSQNIEWKVIDENGTLLKPEEHPSMIALMTGKPVKDMTVGVFNSKRNHFTWIVTNAIPEYRSNSDKPYQVFVTLHDITDEKIALEALHQSEEKFRLLTETSLIGIYIIQDAKIVYVNPSFANILGYLPEEIAGKLSPQDIIHPDDIQTALKKLQERLDGVVENKTTVFKAIKKDGTLILTEVFGMATDFQGRLAVMGSLTDITERSRAEERLRTSEEEYRNLFENSLMAISQTFPESRYLRINKAYAEMYGYPDTETMLREVSGNTNKLFSNPDDRKRVLEILDKSGYMAPAEFELNRRNGEKFWALVGAKQVKDNTGKLLYLQAEHIDITNLKKLEKERYEAFFYARNLIEASLDPLVTINIDGKITDVNLATEQITGLKREMLIGTNFADYFTNPEKAQDGYKTVFKNGIIRDFPLSILHKNGREIEVLYNATLFKNESGEVQGVFAAARDITDWKKMEEELRKSKKLLEKLNQHLLEVRENERNQIALNLHDDLGQKLTAINLDIAWLKSRIGVQSKTVREKFEEMSSMIIESIESIRETSSLLRPSILFDLGLVAAIKSQLGSFKKQTGIKCHFYYKPEEFELEERLALILYRILQESLTNIARHSGASATEIELSIRKNKIEMIITDNGTGIAKDKVTSLESMGIAGMKERVKSVNGKIIIRGETGAGTRIKVVIPLIKEKGDD